MRRHDQRGAATVVGVALAGLLTTFAFGCAGAGAVVVAHRRSQAAADLAALAGAAALQRGSDACAAATDIAGRNQAELASCSVTGDDVLVEVRTTTGPMLGHRYPLSARARAGPVRSGGLAPGPFR